MAKKPKLFLVKSVKQLKRILQDKGRCYSLPSFHYFFIKLDSGIISRKEISLCKNGKFLVKNCVDGTRQYLNEKELQDKDYTNIGIAMKCRAFVCEDAVMIC